VRCAIALVGLLAGCDAVFPLDTRDAPPPVELATCKPEGLVLCLGFEDDLSGGVAIDQSPSHDDATVSQVAQIEAGGQRAIRVDGASSIQVSSATPVDLSGRTTASIDLWLRYDSPPAGVFAGLLDKDNQYGIELGSDGTVTCKIQLNNGTNPVEASARGLTTKKHWYHLACVKTETDVTMYLDGSQLPSASHVAGTIEPPGATLLRIGSDDLQGVPTNAFAGDLDNVRIWNRAMTLQEIADTLLDDHNR
jgi:hypothetical protein